MTTAITVRGGHTIKVKEPPEQVAEKYRSHDDLLYFNRIEKATGKEHQLILRHEDIRTWRAC